MDSILAGCYPFISEMLGMNNPYQSLPYDSIKTEVQFDEEYFPVARGVNLTVGKIQDQQHKEFPIFCHLMRNEQFNIVCSDPKIICKSKRRYLVKPKEFDKINIQFSTVQMLIDDALEQDQPELLKSVLNNLGDCRKGKSWEKKKTA